MNEWGQMSRAARDAAYNNSLAVPDSPALNQARIEASAAFRTSVPGLSGPMAYGDAPRQKWDLFPAEDPDAPCFVFIHGGYWQRNTREEFCALGAGLRAHGWSLAFPGYTLAPEATMTQIAGEIIAALDHLARCGWSGARDCRAGAAVRLVRRRAFDGDGAGAPFGHGRPGDFRHL